MLRVRMSWALGALAVVLVTIGVITTCVLGADAAVDADPGNVTTTAADAGTTARATVLLGSLAVPMAGDVATWEQPAVTQGHRHSLLAAEETGSAADAATTVCRFVRQDEFDAVQKALGSGDQDVQVGRYFTPDNIASPCVAAEQLALPDTDRNPLVGYFDIPTSSLPSEPLATFGPRLVNPDF
jgi:hypothetical protein